MKRELWLASGALLAGFVAAAPASAPTYPRVEGVTQFTQSANYMSLPGYLRWRYYLETRRWISRSESEVCGSVRDQIGNVPLRPTGKAD